jgi:hypothetical protein
MKKNNKNQKKKKPKKKNQQQQVILYGNSDYGAMERKTCCIFLSRIGSIKRF